MWLQAAFSLADLSKVLDQFTPLKLSLGGDDKEQYLYLGTPREVEFVPDVGLRVRTQAKLRWEVIGIKVPATLQSVTVLLMPRIVRIEEHDVLQFGIELEEMDISMSPGIIDRAVVKLINAQLAKEDSQINWRFTETLDFHIAMPALVDSVAFLDLFAKWGEVKVSSDALALAVSFGTRVHRHIAEGAAEPITDEMPAPLEMPDIANLSPVSGGEPRSTGAERAPLAAH